MFNFCLYLFHITDIKQLKSNVMGANILNLEFSSADKKEVSVKSSIKSDNDKILIDRFFEKVEIKALTKEEIQSYRMNAYEPIM